MGRLHQILLNHDVLLLVEQPLIRHEDKTYVNIVVNNRKQIAQIIRELRMQFGFPRISRMSMPVSINETLKAKAC